MGEYNYKGGIHAYHISSYANTTERSGRTLAVVWTPLLIKRSTFYSNRICCLMFTNWERKKRKSVAYST